MSRSPDRPSFPGARGELPEVNKHFSALQLSGDGLAWTEVDKEDVGSNFKDVKDVLVNQLDTLVQDFRSSNQRPKNYKSVELFRAQLADSLTRPNQVLIGTLGNSVRAFYAAYRDDYEEISDYQRGALSSIVSNIDVLETTMPEWRAVMLEMEAIRSSRQDAKIASQAISDMASVFDEAADLVDPSVAETLLRVSDLAQVSPDERGGYTVYQALAYNNVIVSLFRLISDETIADIWIGKAIATKIVAKESFKKMIATFPSIFGWVRSGLESVRKFFK